MKKKCSLDCFQDYKEIFFHIEQTFLTSLYVTILLDKLYISTRYGKHCEKYYILMILNKKSLTADIHAVKCMTFQKNIQATAKFVVSIFLISVCYGPDSGL